MKYEKFVSFFPSYDLNCPYFYREGGQIGYTFMTEKGFQSEVRALRTKEQKNFNLIRGQKWVGYDNLFRIYFNLLKRSRTIDILHIMHINVSSLFASIIYKKVNPHGIIYLKWTLHLWKRTGTKGKNKKNS